MDKQKPATKLSVLASFYRISEHECLQWLRDREYRELMDRISLSDRPELFYDDIPALKTPPTRL